MTNLPRFLLIDADEDSRILLGRALLRRFPTCALLECASLEGALELVRGRAPTAIVVHRADATDGATAVRRLRRAFPSLPILFVSAADRADEAREVGASRFLLRQDWEQTGEVLAQLLGDDAPATPHEHQLEFA